MVTICYSDQLTLSNRNYLETQKICFFTLNFCLTFASPYLLSVLLHVNITKLLKLGGGVGGGGECIS